MQWFTSFLPRLPMFFIVLFCFLPTVANARTAIVRTPEAYLGEVVYTDESGAEQKLNATQNKLTAIHFWATWCIPCVKELPNINALQKKYGNSGLKIISLSLDGDHIDKARQFYNDNKIDALDLFFDSGMNAFRQLNVRVVPTTIFVDAYGKEVARAEGGLYMGNQEVEDFIKSRI